MIKVLFDQQIFARQKYGGVSRYFVELFNAFNAGNDIEVNIPAVFSNNAYIKNCDYVNNYQPSLNFNKKIKEKFFIKINNLIANKSIANQKFDIFHPTYYDSYFLKQINGKPFVLTVHDMIHEKFPQYFHRKVIEWKHELVNEAYHIIAVSENTKKDIIVNYRIPEEKVTVVYHGNSIVSSQSKKPDYLPSRYILFVGARSHYKNFENFIKACAGVIIDNPELSILCIGGGDFSNFEQALFEKLKITKNTFQFQASDLELPAIYNNAELFVFPSIYEGFGIPLLEAFSNECPVACSDASCFPEIAQDAAVYFDPLEKESIKETIKKVIKNKDLKNDLIMKGKSRVLGFSWQKASDKTKNVYQNIVEN